MLRSLREVGWKTKEAGKIIDDRGEELCLKSGTPEMLGRFFAAAQDRKGKRKAWETMTKNMGKEERKKAFPEEELWLDPIIGLL